MSQTEPTTISKEENDIPSAPTALTRVRSRPNDLTRIHTGQHPDDHSYYHNEADQISDTISDNDDEEVDADEQEIVRHESDPRSLAKGIETDREVRNGIANERDIEKNEQPLRSKKSSRSIKDPNLVTFATPHDPENPKNWSRRQKWLATFVVSSFTFISPVSSSMVAPAIAAISKEFGIENEVEEQMVLSAFVLAYAVGPLVLGPLSEIYGRVSGIF